MRRTETLSTETPWRKSQVNSSGMSSKFGSILPFLSFLYTQTQYSFVHDTNLREGEYISASNYNSYNDRLDGDRFEIQIRYHRKIDGKYVKKKEKRKGFSLYIFKAFRALGKILGGARDYMVLTGIHGELVNFREKAQFDTHG